MLIKMKNVSIKRESQKMVDMFAAVIERVQMSSLKILFAFSNIVYTSMQVRRNRHGAIMALVETHSSYILHGL